MTHKHIVIVDGAWVGHHPIYVKVFAKILLEAGYKVSVFCPAPEDMRGWFAQTFSSEDAKFDAYYFSDCVVSLPKFLPRQLSALLTCLINWLHFSKALKRSDFSTGKPDLVFFAWLDNYLSGYVPAWLVDRMFPFAWSGLYFHPRHHRNKQRHPIIAKYIPSPESLVAKSKFACSLAILDAGVVNKLRERLVEKRVFIFPDFTDEASPCANYALAEEIKSKAKGRKIIGLIGSLERRKNLLTLLRIAQQPEAQAWYFVVAGMLAEQTYSAQELQEIELFSETQRDNCFMYFGKIPSDAAFNTMINACDVIFAVYQDFLHSSNLVTKAAAYKKALLVSSGGYMEEVVRQYGLGEVVSAEGTQAALVALSRLTAEDFAHRYSAGMRAYSKAQSQDKLRHVLLGLVEDCIGAIECTPSSVRSGTCR